MLERVMEKIENNPYKAIVATMGIGISVGLIIYILMYFVTIEGLEDRREFDRKQRLSYMVNTNIDYKGLPNNLCREGTRYDKEAGIA